MSNAPSELELLRCVASAAAWAIQSNGDDPVGRDGRAAVGFNWVAANGALNKALRALAEHYPLVNLHIAERAEAEEMQGLLMRKRRR